MQDVGTIETQELLHKAKLDGANEGKILNGEPLSLRECPVLSKGRTQSLPSLDQYKMPRLLLALECKLL